MATLGARGQMDEMAGEIERLLAQGSGPTTIDDRWMDLLEAKGRIAQQGCGDALWIAYSEYIEEHARAKPPRSSDFPTYNRSFFHFYAIASCTHAIWTLLQAGDITPTQQCNESTTIEERPFRPDDDFAAIETMARHTRNLLQERKFPCGPLDERAFKRNLRSASVCTVYYRRNDEKKTPRGLLVARTKEYLENTEPVQEIETLFERRIPVWKGGGVTELRVTDVGIVGNLGSHSTKDQIVRAIIPNMVHDARYGATALRLSL